MSAESLRERCPGCGHSCCPFPGLECGGDSDVVRGCAGSLREQAVKELSEHESDMGDGWCSCGLRLPDLLDRSHRAHLADVVLDVVREWLASDEALEVVGLALRTENGDSLKYRGIPDGGWEPMFSRAILAALIDRTKESP